MLTNGLLAVAVENINGFDSDDDLVEEETERQNKQHTYFVLLLLVTLALATIRLMGVCFRFGISWNKKVDYLVVFL
jgi:hypothetical protein